MKKNIKNIIDEIIYKLKQNREDDPESNHVECEIEISNKVIEVHFCENHLKNEVYVWDKERECYLENLAGYLKSSLPFWYDLTPEHTDYNEWVDHGFSCAREYYNWRGIR